MHVELKSARARDGLHVLIGRVTVSALPPRDRGLTALDSPSELALSQTRPPASHQDQISTLHTNMVSSVSYGLVLLYGVSKASVSIDKLRAPACDKEIARIATSEGNGAFSQS
jgi:hypothetical protein